MGHRHADDCHWIPGILKGSLSAFCYHGTTGLWWSRLRLDGTLVCICEDHPELLRVTCFIERDVEYFA